MKAEALHIELKKRVLLVSGKIKESIEQLKAVVNGEAPSAENMCENTANIWLETHFIRAPTGRS